MNETISRRGGLLPRHLAEYNDDPLTAMSVPVQVRVADGTDPNGTLVVHDVTRSAEGVIYLTVRNDREPEPPWRHGGWYVDNIRYPSGAVGCVSRNFADRKWRIVCDNRPGSFPGGPNDHTYPNRDAAARAEKAIANQAATPTEGA